jgi:hypothetical protein
MCLEVLQGAANLTLLQQHTRDLFDDENANETA